MNKRVKDRSHLEFIRQLPCVVCGDNTSTEAAHIRHGDRRAAKRSTGLAEKADDTWTLPLCGDCHRLQHGMNETAFWKGYGIDPIFVALALFRVAGDQSAGELIIAEARHGLPD